MTRVICRLTGKSRDQLRDPTLGNRVWATFTFFTCWDILMMNTCMNIQMNVNEYAEPATTVRCPLHGPAYYFAYNDLVHGTCPQALSYAQPCAGHSKYQLRFNHCVPTAAFNNRGPYSLYIGWSDFTAIYGHVTFAVLWVYPGIMCGVNRWPFSVLFKQNLISYFKKMSTWSSTYRQSVFQWQ